MSLSDYINFDSLYSSDDLNEDETFPGTKDDYFQIIVDERISSELKIDGKELINSVNLGSCVDLDEEEYGELIDLDSTEVEAFYLHENGYLFYISLNDEDLYQKTIQMFGLIDTETDEYVFVGCLDAHPFVRTNKFLYDNSDGSGPELDEELEQDYSAENLLETMQKFYGDFCKNKFH